MATASPDGVVPCPDAPAPPYARVLSLFSGIGGLDLAAEAAGFQVVAMCEREPFCRDVLAYHWPDVPIYEDVHDITAERLRRDGLWPIHGIIGGPPCQPASVAGKRAGTADDRWLWPAFLSVVRETQCRWFVAENPPGLLSLPDDLGRAGGAFRGILADCDQMGYRVGWGTWGAADVGAPHQRDRVFIFGWRVQGVSLMADTQRLRRERRQGGASWTDGHTLQRDGQEAAVGAEATGAGSGLGVGQAHADREWQRQPQGRITDLGRWLGDSSADGTAQPLAHADEHSGRWAQRAERGGVGGASRASARDEGHPQRLAAECGGATVADAAQRGPRCRTASWSGRQPAQPDEVAVGQADSAEPRLPQRPGAPGERSHAATAGGGGRDVAPRLGDAADGLPLALVGRAAHPSPLDAFPGWPAGPNAAQYEWEPPRTTTERVPDRAAKLKALGNAVVPWQARVLFEALAAVLAEGKDCAPCE